MTDPAVAAADPELAVLSVMAHGRDADIAATVRIAVAAQAVTEGLDEERSRLYLDLILASLSEAARPDLPESFLESLDQRIQRAEAGRGAVRPR